MLPVQILTWVIKWKELWAKGCFSVWRWYSGLTPLQVGIHMNPLWLRPGSHQNLLTCVLWQFPSQLFFFFLLTAKSKQTQYSETRATVSLKTSFHCLLNTPIRRLWEKFQYNTEEFYVIPLDIKATICTASLKNASCSKQMPQKHKISVDLDNPPSTFIFCLQLFFYGSLAATCSPACWLCQSTD